MKTKIKLFLFLLTITGVGFSQEVHYIYDDAGNRVERFSIEPSGMMLDDDSAEKAEERRELSDQISITAQPNPTSNSVTISVDFENIEPQPLNMKMYDVSGKIVSDNTQQSTEQVFNLQAHPKGIYFVKVFSSDGTIVKEAKVVRE